LAWETAVTTTSSDDALERARIAIRGEILRWNRVMNLVSRQDTPRQLDRLLEQCTTGFDLITTALAELDISLETTGYADVGSGNGLPGLLWAAGIAKRGGRGPIWLVEPRQRRAWFLSRVARQDAFPDLSVVAGRWGAPLPGSSTPGDMLVSLKALRLTEPDVLGGLERSFARTDDAAHGPQRVVIARFLGPEQSQDEGTACELQISRAVGEPVWRQTGHRTLEGPGVRLLTTAYRRA
jgi:hypothetical protein